MQAYTSASLTCSSSPSAPSRGREPRSGGGWRPAARSAGTRGWGITHPSGGRRASVEPAPGSSCWWVAASAAQ